MVHNEHFVTCDNILCKNTTIIASHFSFNCQFYKFLLSLNKIRIFLKNILIILIYTCTYCYSQTSKIKYDATLVQPSSDSFIIEVIGNDGNKHFSSKNVIDSFYSNFNAEKPEFFYLFVNKLYNKINTIFVNDTLVEFRITQINPLNLLFPSSQINHTFQEFIKGEDKLNQLSDSIADHIKKIKSIKPKEVVDSLIRIYRKEKEYAEHRIIQHEDEFIRSHKNSFLSLFIIYKSIEGFKRSDIITTIDNFNSSAP